MTTESAPQTDTRSEADIVAEKERRPRKRRAGEDEPRLSLHINWNKNEESEMLYYQAFRAMPRGLSKRVVIKFLDVLVGDCTNVEEITNIFYAWTRARDTTSRAVMTGGAPLDWRTPGRARATVEDVQAQPKQRYDDFVRSQFVAPPARGWKWAMVPDHDTESPKLTEQQWLRRREEQAALEEQAMHPPQGGYPEPAMTPEPMPEEHVTAAPRQPPLPMRGVMNMNQRT